ncbi:RNA polymerase alpha subunit C-terminal domain-containing protein [Dyadobacter sp. CY261]|uniref:RNA polymerase alpha subunit C-terminal domain-containing protein n=1 Tax=Dyadobacter sp. CY261 TaxID=2907203 RepID=UPI001F4846C1|nr:RNA polymerase alpha subunit C-terminal domain-containing protein [Dyadobacter sp. CY261]MCF0068898.1 RNA polymerase alpha subunit C-terminal domain-containing protein [Dyadobacter sp. CY261]
MANSEKNLRICPNGHRYYKSSDCPTCPVCEAEKNPTSGFTVLISAPARRALENNGIHTMEELAAKTEKELLGYHGIGPNAISKLKTALEENGMSFLKS